MARELHAATSELSGWLLRRESLAAAVLVGGAIVVGSSVAPAIWPVVLTDGLLVAALLLAAGGWGAWPARWLGSGTRPIGQRFCMATAIGLGVLSAATLTLGVVGSLSRVAAWALIGGGLLLGLTRAYLGQADSRTAAPGAPPAPRPRASRLSALQSLVLLPLCVPLGIALFGAALPPGLLWTGEAGGYDVLEYHLQLPREYFEAGRIDFLPHNVYASFPLQVEMLYLLLMYLRGNPLDAATAAQLLHVLLGSLAVGALAAWGAPGWPRILVAVVVGSVPWLAYAGCLAYVELGTVFFAAVAGGLVVDQVESGKSHDWRTAAAAGLCAGLAGGCKYIAVAFVTAGLALAWAVAMTGDVRRRITRCAVYSAAALAALSPWLIRNTAFTGNPVYPFAYRWFDGAAWSAEQAEQWAAGHRLAGAQPGRARVLADELFGSAMFGPALWLLPLLGVALRPTRQSWLAVAWLALIVAGWAAFTHMPGRFAMPVVVPLALVLGRAGNGSTQRNWLSRIRRLATGPLLALAVLGAIVNAATLRKLLRSEEESWSRQTGRPLKEMVDQVGLQRAANLVNQVITSGNAYVWLVGDARVFYLTPRVHYTVVFSRDPWLQFAAGGASPADCVAWLRTRTVTHVVFSWAEIERLRKTYGFPPVVTPEWVAGLERARLRRLATPEALAGTQLPEIYEVVAE